MAKQQQYESNISLKEFVLSKLHAHERLDDEKFRAVDEQFAAYHSDQKAINDKIDMLIKNQHQGAGKEKGITSTVAYVFIVLTLLSSLTGLVLSIMPKG